MNTRTRWSRILKIVGRIAMLLGTLDPLEGSLLLLPGSGRVALDLFVGKAEQSLLRYWLTEPWLSIPLVILTLWLCPLHREDLKRIQETLDKK